MEEKIEYIIYCRKSTDEKSEHQKQSIPDQIKICMDYAKREWLQIMEKPKDFSNFENEEDIKNEDNETDLQNRKIFLETRNLFIIKEQETWKIPWKRKKWNKLIKLIKSWKIKGLISYSPDRQARNMLEWWELINLVDEWLIDLKYTNFHFENNASWKMMLWIWFVFSKQYSDKLSEDVSRWNKKQIESWKTNWITKHWYKRNKDWYHEPDWKNFELIKEAFEMKLKWIPEANILEFLNSNWYSRKWKNNKEKWITKTPLNKIFKDPFYYWILISWDNSVDLREVNPYYIPAISEEDFQFIQENFVKTKTIISKTSDKFSEIKSFEKWFLKTPDWYWLICYLPNVKRYYDKIKKAKKEWKNLSLKDIVKPNQIRYKTSSDSKEYKIDITFAEIDKIILKALSSFKIWEKEFEEYKKFTNERLENIIKENKEKISRKNTEISRIKKQRDEYISKNMWIKKDKLEEKIYNEEKGKFENKINFVRKEIEEIETYERNEIVELEAFINIISNAKKYYQKANYVQKGKIAKILFLNIIVENKKSLKIQVKPELQSLFNSNDTIWLRRQELNLWSSGYEPDEIPLLHSAKKNFFKQKSIWKIYYLLWHGYGESNPGYRDENPMS